MDAKLLMMSGAAPFEMYPYDAVNSARFDGTTSDYLNFTPGAGNRKLWTFSTWYKRCASTQQDILIAGADSNNKTQITVESSNKINFELVSGGAGVGQRQTTAVLLDPSSWYHIVIVCDSASGTPEDRQQIYINGVRITSFSTNTTTTLNTDTFFNNSQAMYLGRRSYSTAANLNGYLSQTCFIDGAALTASSFGEDKNGVWVPSDPTGLTFGDEGWLLAYASSGALGDDTSGNGNDWTVNGLAAADQMTDKPSGSNFPTWSPLKFRTPSLLAVLSEGNLAALFDNGSYGEYAFGTMSIPAEGKWYWEIKCTAVGGESNHGIVGANVPEGNPDLARSYRNNGKKYANFSTAADYGATWTTNDVIGVAVDMDGGNLYFYKNNAIQDSGTAAYTDLLTAIPAGGWTPVANGYNNASALANFGQSAFTYTPPSGYISLNAANLPEPTIGPDSGTTPSKVFAAVLYTGNGTAIGSGGKVITSLDFQPDMVWIKNRDAADQWMVFDSVRGVTKYQSLDSQNVEATDTESLTAFNSNGFSLGNNVAVNTNTEDYVAYCFKITAGFFDIQGYTGTGSAKTEAHDLGVVPQWVTTRVRDLASQNWITYVESLPVADPETDFIYFDANAAATDNAAMWNDTAPTSSVFTVGTNNGTNSNTKTYIAYLFADMEGFCKVGYYTGNGNADGMFEALGLSPQFHLIKKTSATGSWYIYDTTRSPHNEVDVQLLADTTAAETTGSEEIDINSNGVKQRSADTEVNVSSGDYITLSIGTSFKYSNAR